jgi:hypothetical protein
VVPQLSATFMVNLTKGFLKPVRDAVVGDKDLDLHIGNNYLNIYYKEHSLLKLTEEHGSSYTVEIHPEFTAEVEVPDCPTFVL